ncbi:hypothetical protein AAFF_G00024960 [Aldrovandia affinis]|uniref:Uncharacterized protein n=1 Tax=Aldrovandia affinis TaxID=143900 RepID=A0AAD7WZT4_9TELE|nr:hypothetical protein AAFF_G00024960 [Aldrovandia affinis]
MEDFLKLSITSGSWGSPSKPTGWEARAGKRPSITSGQKCGTGACGPSKLWASLGPGCLLSP